MWCGKLLRMSRVLMGYRVGAVRDSVLRDHLIYLWLLLEAYLSYFYEVKS